MALQLIVLESWVGYVAYQMIKSMETNKYPFTHSLWNFLTLYGFSFFSTALSSATPLFLTVQVVYNQISHMRNRD